MTTLDLTVRHVDGTAAGVRVRVARVANLGMAGRTDPAADVRDRQVAAMNDAGVETPPDLPFVVPKPAHLVTTARTIQVNSQNTAGEAEFVLFPTGERTYVGVGNDHKDRDLSRTAMHKANSTCPSVVSDEVWVLDEIREHWDDLELRSWVEADGDLRPQQRATLDRFMEPEAILDAVERRIDAPLAGTAVWSGTVGAGDGANDGAVDPFPSLAASAFNAVQLYDPVRRRRLFARYDVRVNDWIAGVDPT